jgi:hypothetical protein
MPVVPPMNVCLTSIAGMATRQLADPNLNPGSRDDAARIQLERLISEASQLLDWTERYVPR